jgi:hypothetical protein
VIVGRRVDSPNIASLVHPLHGQGRKEGVKVLSFGEDLGEAKSLYCQKKMFKQVFLNTMDLCTNFVTNRIELII